jgi:hypothetical protein
MKSRLKPIIIVFALIALYSCKDVEDFTQRVENGTISATVSVDEPDNEGNSVTFEDSSELNLSNALPEGLDDFIENISINALTYEISGFNGATDATVTNASFTLGTTNISVSDINLDQADANNTVFSVSDSSQLNAIGNALLSNPILPVTFNATIDSTPVAFNILINVDVTVRINLVD